MDVGQLAEPHKFGVLATFIFFTLLSLLGYQNYPLVNFLGLALTKSSRQLNKQVMRMKSITYIQIEFIVV